MPGHDIIVVGASAGGVEALSQFMQNLPQNLPAAIFVVLHVPAEGFSVLPRIINRSIKKRQPNSSLLALHPQDGEKIEYGRIYVAPPDRHLLVKNGHIKLAHGPKENSTRPAIDPLFRTAARYYGRNVVGIVLSGLLDDGTAGLLAIKQQGGVAIVQDPEEALFSGMPRSAIENVNVDYILPISGIASVLIELAEQPVEQAAETVSHDMEMEADMAELEPRAMHNPERPGNPSPFGCPECGGVLWELDEGNLIRFRCRTGHAFSTGTLLAEQSEDVETALWNALRALEEKAALTERMASRARDRNQSLSFKRFEEQAQTSRQRANLVRKLLLKGEGNNGDLSTANRQVVGNNGLASSTTKPSQIVAIAASDDGLNALPQVLSALPENFPAAITVVQHVDLNHSSMMAEILERRISLPVQQAKAGDYLQSGKVYIAPPNHHLLVNPDGTLTVSPSELVHFARPSANLLFESVAASFKQQAIAVVLTGLGSNAAMGVRAIKEMGGTVIAQDRETSELFDLPGATETEVVDQIVPLDEIGSALINLVITKAEEFQEP